MKKILIVFALFAFLATGTLFAEYPGGFGIGVQGGYGGVGGGAGLTLKFPSLPIFFNIDAVSASDSGFHLAAAGDYYFIHNDLLKETDLDYYVGFGIGASLWGFDDKLGIAAAARLPIGLSWQPITLLELYLQVVPQIGLQILPDFKLWTNFWGANIGLRLWF